MTYKEAIENLQYLINDYTETQHDFVEETEMAIKALEKQIPKTPKIFKEKYMQPDYLCPVCDADVDHEWDYCAGCGQTLDWSDEE